MRRALALTIVCVVGCGAKVAPPPETTTDASTTAPDASIEATRDGSAPDAGTDSFRTDASSSDSPVAVDADVAVDPGAIWTVEGVSPKFVNDPSPCGLSAAKEKDVVLDSGLGFDWSAFPPHGDRVLTSRAGWILWDRITGNEIARSERTTGTTTPHIVVSGAGGNTFTVQRASSVEVRDMTSGALRTNIAGAFECSGVSTDGSYVWTADATAVTFWSSASGARIAKHDEAIPCGIPLFAGPSDFLFGSLAELRRIDPKSGTSTMSSLPAGEEVFALFADGSAVVTRTGLEFIVRDAKTLALLGKMPSGGRAGGYGRYAWVAALTSLGSTDGTRVFDLRSPAAAVLSYSESVTPTFGVRPATPRPSGFRSIDLTTTPPTVRDRAVELNDVATSISEAADGVWTAVQLNGAAWTAKDTETPRALGCGLVESVAAADDGTVALATATKVVLAKTTATGTVVKGYFPIVSDYVAISRNGKTLVIIDKFPGTDVKFRLHVYDVPTLTSTLTLAAPATGQRHLTWLNVSIADAGDRVGIAGWHGLGSKGIRAVLDAKTGAVVRAWPVDTTEMKYFEMQPIYLSPDGKRVALPRRSALPDITETDVLGIDAPTVMKLEGGADGWLGNELIVHLYGSGHTYGSTEVVGDGGAVMASWVYSDFDVSAGPFSAPRKLSGDRIFFHDVVFDTSTREIVWTTHGGRGGITTDRLIGSGSESGLILASPIP